MNKRANSYAAEIRGALRKTQASFNSIDEVKDSSATSVAKTALDKVIDAHIDDDTLIALMRTQMNEKVFSNWINMRN